VQNGERHGHAGPSQLPHQGGRPPFGGEGGPPLGPRRKYQSARGRRGRSPEGVIFLVHFMLSQAASPWHPEQPLETTGEWCERIGAQTPGVHLAHVPCCRDARFSSDAPPLVHDAVAAAPSLDTASSAPPHAVLQAVSSSGGGSSGGWSAGGSHSECGSPETIAAERVEQPREAASPARPTEAHPEATRAGARAAKGGGSFVCGGAAAHFAASRRRHPSRRWGDDARRDSGRALSIF
jgi:hypothetical protein